MRPAAACPCTWLALYFHYLPSHLLATGHRQPLAAGALSPPAPPPHACPLYPCRYGHRSAGFFGYSAMTGSWDGGQAEYVRVPFGEHTCLSATVHTHQPPCASMFRVDNWSNQLAAPALGFAGACGAVGAKLSATLRLESMRGVDGAAASSGCNDSAFGQALALALPRSFPCRSCVHPLALPVLDLCQSYLPHMPHPDPPTPRPCTPLQPTSTVSRCPLVSPMTRWCCCPTSCPPPGMPTRWARCPRATVWPSGGQGQVGAVNMPVCNARCLACEQVPGLQLGIEH